VGTEGTIFVADRNLPGIWKFADEQWSIFFFVGTKQFRTPLNAVRCLGDRPSRIAAGRATSATREIYRFDVSGRPQPLTSGRIGIPMALAVAKDGTIFASNLENSPSGQKSLPMAASRRMSQSFPPSAGWPSMRKDALIAVCHGRNSVVRLSADGKRGGRSWSKASHFRFPAPDSDRPAG